jgi:hypothetical protein
MKTSVHNIRGRSVFRKILTAFALVAACGFVTHEAVAAGDSNKTIDQVGAQTTWVGFFSVVEGWGTDCAFTLMYIDTTTATGRVVYSTVLAAKLAGRQLASVTYSQDPASKACYASLVIVK